MAVLECQFATLETNEQFLISKKYPIEALRSISDISLGHMNSVLLSLQWKDGSLRVTLAQSRSDVIAWSS